MTRRTMGLLLALTVILGAIGGVGVWLLRQREARANERLKSLFGVLGPSLETRKGPDTQLSAVLHDGASPEALYEGTKSAKAAADDGMAVTTAMTTVKVTGGASPTGPP